VPAAIKRPTYSSATGLVSNGAEPRRWMICAEPRPPRAVELFAQRAGGLQSQRHGAGMIKATFSHTFVCARVNNSLPRASRNRRNIGGSLRYTPLVFTDIR